MGGRIGRRRPVHLGVFRENNDLNDVFGSDTAVAKAQAVLGQVAQFDLATKD